MRRSWRMVLAWGLVAGLMGVPLAGGWLFPGASGLDVPVAVPKVQIDPLYEQWLVIVTFFGIKALYTALTGWLIWRLRNQRAEDVAALWWGLVAFFIGEGFCFINAIWCGDLSVGLEWLHGSGMVVFLACVTYAAIRMVDTRLLSLEQNRPCAMAPLCDTCTKMRGLCRLRRVGLAVILAAAVVALIPLTWRLRADSFTGPLLGKPHVYAHPVAIQIFEWRFLPVAAVGLMAAAWLRMAVWEFTPQRTSSLLFAAGCGAAGFSLLRLLMVGTFFEHQPWFVVWEESTEMVMIGGIAWLLHVFPGWERVPAAMAGEAMREVSA